MGYYTHIIKKVAEAKRRSDVDPRHVEGYMRLKGGINSWSFNNFQKEVYAAIDCIDANGIEKSEALAKSYWL